jgi:endonuclease V-like protein UPF0215 family
MRKLTIEIDDEIESSLDQVAGRLIYRMAGPRVPVSLEQVAVMALLRGIDLLKSETIIRTPSVGGKAVDPSESFRPSNRAQRIK